MQALTRVHLRATTTVEDGGDNDINEHNANYQQINLLPTANKCVTVSKLGPDIKLEEQSLVQIATTFPAVVHLCLGHIHPESMPPFSQIFRLWPQLEHLKIKGRSLHFCVPTATRNFVESQGKRWTRTMRKMRSL